MEGTVRFKDGIIIRRKVRKESISKESMCKKEGRKEGEQEGRIRNRIRKVSNNNGRISNGRRKEE